MRTTLPPILSAVLIVLLLSGCAEERSPSGGAGVGGGGGSSGGAGAGGSGNQGGTSNVTPPPEGPSCESLPNCAIGDEPASCCQTLYVPGGTFGMGRGSTDACTPEMASCYEIEQPEHQATVPPFFLDTFEVTIARFRKFAEAYQAAPQEGDGAIAYAPGSGWTKDFDALLPDAQAARETMLSRVSWTGSDNPDTQSVVMVSWAEAFAFCVWDGGRLPTEAEWEFAAVGGDENRLFPWGDDFTKLNEKITICDFPQAACNPEDYVCSLSTDFNALPAREKQVGAKPDGAGRWGHQNLVDGWSEWVYDSDSDYKAGACVDEGCISIPKTTDEGRMRRGASIVAGNLGIYRGTYRFYSEQSGGSTVWGTSAFRCAREIPKQ